MFHIAALAGAGPSADGATGRVEAVGRFHVDPFRQRRWGLYGAAGAGVHWADSSEPYLLFPLGVEGRAAVAAGLRLSSSAWPAVSGLA
jgi:hypothetical protein